MKRILTLSAGTCLALLGACLLSSQAVGQSVTFDFQDGTDQGFGTGFGDDASKTFSIVNIGGSLQMSVPRTGAFQEAAIQTGNPASALFLAMAAAANNPAGYILSYDYYIDTSLGGAGTFFQLGTYVNTGNGFYAQDFGSPKEVELDSTQLASGGVFSGHVSVNMAAVGFSMPAAQTFFRLGIIENGNGAPAVYFDNISVTPVPEPTSLSLLGLAAPALWMMRRRKF